MPPGRNDPCYCGSGKKYKKCHLRADEQRAAEFRQLRPTIGRRSLPPEIARELARVEAARAEKFERYGDVRDIIHADFQGEKFVAVWNELHHSPNWKTFHDFLFDFIKTALVRVFGPEWAPAELKKPPSERHPILRWYDGLCGLQARAKEAGQKSADGIFEAEVDGPSAAYLNLAYDLYTLAHNNLLQAPVVQRLKDRTTFRSARYELTVAAAVLRAGFTIKPEDEADTTTRHPEFIATHKRSGERIAVEAKSKWRRGVIEWKLNTPPPEDFKLNIQDLLLDAVGKLGDIPLVVFIDANMPPQIAINEHERWLADLAETLKETTARAFSPTGEFEGVPFSALVLTNFPHDYAAPGEPDPGRIGLISVPAAPRVAIQDPSLLHDLERALKQYGSVPKEFP